MPRFSCVTRYAFFLASFLIFASALALDVVTEAREPAGEPLSPETLFQQVSPSVFIVEGLGPDGKVIKQGSNVFLPIRA